MRLLVDATDQDFARVFGATLRQLRKASGMKQAALGHASGYDDHSIISKIETGKTLPSLPQAYRLAHALHVPLEAFIGRMPPEALRVAALVALVLQEPVACRSYVVTVLRLLTEMLELGP